MPESTDSTNGAQPEREGPAVVSSISSARLHFIIFGLWLCLFISALDTTIVTTALVKISSGFNSLEQGPWLVTAYLLTYNSFLMITAKLSDIWGLKTLLMGCAGIFLVFSMACGGAQTMVQLIVFRAFQGIGGSGLYSLTFVAIMKLASPEKLALYTGVISSVFAVANLLGPLFGGIISDRTTWRWIFFINGPVVVIALITLFVSMPALKDGKSNRERVRNLDGIGGLLSICWPIPLIFALQEAGGSFSWKSGTIIGTLTAGIVLFIVFGVYETWVTYRTKMEPIFPAHFLRNPSMALTLLSMFLVGMPFYVVFVQLPQRFQTVNFTSAERAGILLLPATAFTPVGVMIAGLAMKKTTPEIVLIFATCLVCLGMGLLSSLPASSALWAGTYGYEILTGLGLGLASPIFYVLMNSSIPEQDISSGTGAVNMVRTLGGCVAVAICSAVHRNFTSMRLSTLLSPEQIAAVQSSGESIARLPADTRSQVGEIFGKSFNRQFHVMLAFTGLNIIVSVILALVRKKMGLYGAVPERKEANEFMHAREEDNVPEPSSVEKQTVQTTAEELQSKRNEATDLITRDQNQMVK